jgi:glycosyltransferase involved in cell wall biosynthesis
VETWLDEINSVLTNDGWRVTVALLHGCAAHDAERYRRAHPALNTVVVDGRGLNADSRQRSVMRCLQRVAPDVCVPLTAVDAHDAVCRAKCAGWPGRYLLTVRGNIPVQLADARRHMLYADGVICSGSLTARVLRQFGMPENRTWHIPNGARAATVRRHDREPGDTVIRLGYVGRLAGGEKRAGDLLGLCDALECEGVSYRLTVAGDGILASAIREGVKTRGLTEKVTFSGSLDHDTLYARVYPNLEVLLLFSESEAFGIVLVEAMKHGVVPVSSRFVGYRAEGLVRDGWNARLFGVGDLRSAARLVAQLGRDTAQWNALSAAAVTTASAYTWERCGVSWCRALAEIREMPRRNTPGTLPVVAAPAGRLERFPLSATAVDALRRLRRRVFGVPRFNVGGEEWPFARRDHDPADLSGIAQLAQQLDEADNADDLAPGTRVPA